MDFVFLRFLRRVWYLFHSRVVSTFFPVTSWYIDFTWSYDFFHWSVLPVFFPSGSMLAFSACFMPAIILMVLSVPSTRVWKFASPKPSSTEPDNSNRLNSFFPSWMTGPLMSPRESLMSSGIIQSSLMPACSIAVFACAWISTDGLSTTFNVMVFVTSSLHLTVSLVEPISLPVTRTVKNAILLSGSLVIPFTLLADAIVVFSTETSAFWASLFALPSFIHTPMVKSFVSPTTMLWSPTLIPSAKSHSHRNVLESFCVPSPKLPSFHVPSVNL